MFITDYNIFNIVIASTALIGAATVWFSYSDKWQKENIEEPKKILKAIRKELELIGAWARGVYPDISREDYKKRREFDEFYNPSRMIFDFEFLTIRSIADKNLIRYFGDNFIEKFISLKQAILNFQQYNERLNRVAMNYPDRYLSVSRKLAEDKCVILKNYTKEEREYMEMIYSYNYKIHHKFIGGDWNEEGLHVKYKEALNVLGQEEFEHNKKKKLPWWYFLGQMMAILFIIFGIGLILLFCVVIF